MVISLRRLKKLGFESHEELIRLVRELAVGGKTTWDEFLNWKKTDGTKAGLMKLLERVRGGSHDKGDPADGRDG